MSALLKVAIAATHYVQFLDPDSVADQESDVRLRIERLEAEDKLIRAVEALQKEQKL